MSISRRNFFQSAGAGAVGTLMAPYLSGRGLEAMTMGPHGVRTMPAYVPSDIRLNSNENPNGCAPETLRAFTVAMAEHNRYPRASTTMLSEAIASSFNVKPENVVLGCGSTDILRAAVYAYCGAGKHLVTASPSFENPVEDAKRIGAEVRAVPVTGKLKLDLDAMAAVSRGAGLVFLCNPNNPTSTVHGAAAIADFVARVTKESPTTTILIDEAYHEYVDDPTYASSLPIAMQNPRVFIARTFSKVHGMAGMRAGYALGQEKTMKELAPLTLNMGVNQLAASGALIALGLREHIEREQKLNRAAREFTLKRFSDLGLQAAESNANFIMVDLQRDAQPFRDACKAMNVIVGRPFPPLDKYVRVSIGTMEEMQRATAVFKRVLTKA